MSPETEQVIREATRGSSEGSLHFGQVVGLLVQAGVESYVADYRAGRTTYYLHDGDTLTIDLTRPGVPIAQAFDAAALLAANRGAQRGEVMYPQFKTLSCQAGCVGYAVWIAGRHVSYFGRQGETHIERLPD
jgi:uncharacterized protein YbcV (DUF1398 family)